MKRTANYFLAITVFLITMLFFSLGPIVITLGAALGGVIFGGESGLDRAYYFLMDHLNFYSVLVYLLAFVTFALWYYFAYMEREGTGRFLNTRLRRVPPAGYGWIAVLTFAMQHVTSIIFAVIAIILPKAMEAYTNMVEDSGMSDYSIMWAVSTLILPPLTEEIIFRGLIQGYLKKARAPFLLANLIQAVMFGIFHMNLVQGIYAGLLGLILGYLAERYGTLIAPMFMHLLFNLFGTVLVDLENMFMPDILYLLLVFLSVPLLVLTLLMIKFRVGERKQENVRL